jgi:hypothetical protein
MTKKQTRTASIETRVKQKLNPRRFTGMSGKMAAIVGYILGTSITTPELVEIVITSDGFVLGRQSGDIGMNEFIGAESDLRSNWSRLLDAAGLTEAEKKYANTLYKTKIYKF